MFFFLLSLSGSIPDNMPILKTECEDGEYFDTYGYECLSCESNPNIFYCHTQPYVSYNGTDFIETNECLAPNHIIYDLCISDETYNAAIQSINSISSVRFTITDDACSMTIGTNEMTEEFCRTAYDLLIAYFSTVSVLPYPRSIQFISNLVSQFGYSRNEFPYNLLTDIPQFGSNLNRHQYQNWPQDGPFIDYPVNFDLTYVLSEEIILSHFEFAEVTQFYLATYTWDGVFKGFQPLTFQLNKCSQKNNIGQLWRQFGSDYSCECFFDLTRLKDSEPTDFYEPFFEDGVDSNGYIIIRPIPVLINWYYYDAQRDTHSVRRFSIMNNNTNSIQILNRTNITFVIQNEDQSRINPPIISLERREIPKSDLTYKTAEISSNQNSNQHPFFQFFVHYSMNMETFQQVFLILVIILAVFALIIAIIRIIVNVMTEGRFNMLSNNFLEIVYSFLDTIALFFFITSFGFSLFVFIFYKFQKFVFWCLPDSDILEFTILRNFLYCALAFEGAASLIKMFFVQPMNHFFLMDWESPSSEGVPVSAWRRINVANELNRIFTIRSYSVPFTLIVITFCLEGLDLEFLSIPIPTTDLIDVGSSYWMLRYAISTIFWLGMIIVQYIWTHIFYRRFWGNPFYNFLDLCTTSNISLFITTSTAHGFYLHGRSVNSHTDVEMKKLSQNLSEEHEGLVGLRGLLAGSKEQVFECYFANDFYQQYQQISQVLQKSQKTFPLKVSLKELSSQTLESYDEINKFLQKTFDGSSTENKYIVLQPGFLQVVFNAPPTVLNETVLKPVKDDNYKKTLLGGVEFSLIIFYMLLFCVIDIHLESTCIAAFIVFIIDFLLVRIFRKICRARLARESLLDTRFLLS